MSHSSRYSIDACASQLSSWRPFHHQYQTLTTAEAYTPTKRPCLSDRTTSFSTIDAAIDISRLSLSTAAAADDSPYHKRGSLRSLIARKKRRRRGSRSVSGRSSVGAAATATATNSDFPVMVGTDSSGEMFGEGNWASDVSEAKRERGMESLREEREGLSGGVGFGGQFGNFDAQGIESGYGSEPGYRGDAEFGYGDEVEVDEEEEDSKLLFWGTHHFGDTDSNMEMVGENTFSDQKSHHRGRRKKHDCRVVDSMR